MGIYICLCGQTFDHEYQRKEHEERHHLLTNHGQEWSNFSLAMHLDEIHLVDASAKMPFNRLLDLHRNQHSKG